MKHSGTVGYQIKEPAPKTKWHRLFVSLTLGLGASVALVAQFGLDPAAAAWAIAPFALAGVFLTAKTAPGVIVWAHRRKERREAKARAKFTWNPKTAGAGEPEFINFDEKQESQKKNKRISDMEDMNKENDYCFYYNPL